MEILDLKPSSDELLKSVRSGLTHQPKTLEPKFNYNKAGSVLFDEICATPEYYPTRTEIGILQDQSEAIRDEIGPDCLLYEYGSGSSQKIRILLEALDSLAAYVPIDISGEHLRDSAVALKASFPGLEIIPVCADYTDAIELPIPEHHQVKRKVGFFPGSTIGNFEPEVAKEFLRTAREMVGPEGGLLIGMDTKKDQSTLLRAYDDAQGVTAQFNLNILDRINLELGADFDLTQFKHEARYNADEGRIEMHLVSQKEQIVNLKGTQIEFQPGESIHTENSYKYSDEDARNLLAQGGFELKQTWKDPDSLFSVRFATTL